MYFLNILRDLKNKYDIIGDVRRLGLSLAAEINNKNGRQKTDEIADRIMYACLGKGLNFKSPWEMF